MSAPKRKAKAAVPVDWSSTPNAARKRRMMTFTLAPETDDGLVELKEALGKSSRSEVIDELVAEKLATCRRKEKR